MPSFSPFPWAGTVGPNVELFASPPGEPTPPENAPPPGTMDPGRYMDCLRDAQDRLARGVITESEYSRYVTELRRVAQTRYWTCPPIIPDPPAPRGPSRSQEPPPGSNPHRGFGPLRGGAWGEPDPVVENRRPAYPGGTMTNGEMRRCFNAGLELLNRGEITQAQYNEYADRVHAAAQRPGGTCPALPRRIEPPTTSPPPAEIPLRSNKPNTVLCNSLGESYVWGPTGRVLTITRLDGSRIEYNVGVVPAQIIRRWPPGSFAAPTCPTYTRPGIWTRVRGWFGGGRGGNAISWIGLIPDPSEIAEGINTCLTFRANWTTAAYNLCESYKELKKAFGDKRREMEGYLKTCKMSRECVQQCSTYLRLLDNAIKVVSTRETRACESYAQALAFNCTISMTGLRLDVEMQAVDIALQALTRLFNEALNTLELWDTAIAQFAKKCGCKETPWDPIEIDPEERRHDDKFWRGDMPRIDWK